MIKGLKLQIYPLPGFTPVQVYTLSDQTTGLEWSNDSEYLLCVQGKRGLLQVLARTGGWNARISMGEVGVMKAGWTPDSRKVWTVGDCMIRLTIWSLVDKEVCHIRHPKHPPTSHHFSHDGHFLSLLERHSGKDYLGIYSTTDWALHRVSYTQHIPLDSTDAVDLVWSLTDTEIIVWESPLECSFFVYNAINGALVARRKIYESALGIKSASLSPNGMFLSFGLYDQSLRLFSHISWRQVLNCAHTQSSLSSVSLYQEEEYRDSDSHQLSTHYTILDSYTLSPLQVPTDTPSPPMGVSVSVWSSDSHYLASRNDLTPNIVWIWDTQKLQLHSVLIHIDTVKKLQWTSRGNVLAVSTGQNRVFIWTETGASVCDVPTDNGDFRVGGMKWSERGDCLLLMDKASLMVAFTHLDPS